MSLEMCWSAAAIAEQQQQQQQQQRQPWQQAGRLYKGLKSSLLLWQLLQMCACDWLAAPAGPAPEGQQHKQQRACASFTIRQPPFVIIGSFTV
jgi:hypothetical protein